MESQITTYIQYILFAVILFDTTITYLWFPCENRVRTSKGLEKIHLEDRLYRRKFGWVSVVAFFLILLSGYID